MFYSIFVPTTYQLASVFLLTYTLIIILDKSGQIK